MKILGLDYSYYGTGISVIDQSKSLVNKLVFDNYNTMRASKTVVHNPFTDKEPNSKLDFACKRIFQFVQEVNPDLIVMEESLFFSGTFHSWMSGYIILKYLFRISEIPYLMIPPVTLKYFAIKGNASKEEMETALLEKYPQFNFSEYGNCANDLVDATWLAILGVDFLKFKENQDMTTWEGIFGEKEISIFQKILKESEKFI